MVGRSPLVMPNGPGSEVAPSARAARAGLQSVRKRVATGVAVVAMDDFTGFTHISRPEAAGAGHLGREPDPVPLKNSRTLSWLWIHFTDAAASRGGGGADCRGRRPAPSWSSESGGRTRGCDCRERGRPL